MAQKQNAYDHTRYATVNKNSLYVIWLTVNQNSPCVRNILELLSDWFVRLKFLAIRNRKHSYNQVNVLRAPPNTVSLDTSINTRYSIVLAPSTQGISILKEHLVVYPPEISKQQHVFSERQ
jgi:hypothetical protein